MSVVFGICDDVIAASDAVALDARYFWIQKSPDIAVPVAVPNATR
jgi:hypothetical protein